MVRVCFVCLGNICRSPTAEAAFRDCVKKAGLEGAIEIDSAGTGDWHVGHSPDRRSIAAGKKRGIELTGKARQFQTSDWARFDYVLAMDQSNYDTLAGLAPAGATKGKLFLFRSFDAASPPGASVPDPYYTTDGFDEVIDHCIAAAEGLLEHIVREHGLSR